MGSKGLGAKAADITAEFLLSSKMWVWERTGLNAFGDDTYETFQDFEVFYNNNPGTKFKGRGNIQLLRRPLMGEVEVSGSPHYFNSLSTSLQWVVMDLASDIQGQQQQQQLFNARQMLGDVFIIPHGKKYIIDMGLQASTAYGAGLPFTSTVARNKGTSGALREDGTNRVIMDAWIGTDLLHPY